MNEQEPSKSADDRFGLDRLVFFSDAIFAIAITLLVLDLRLPVREGPRTESQLLADLTSIWPDYRAYLISFLVVGSFWISHHRKFRRMVRYDEGLLVINLLFLMVIAFIPFPTIVISEVSSLTGTIFYSLTILAAGLLSLALTWYATGPRRLMAVHPPHTRRHELLRGLIVPGVFLLSIGLALVDHELVRFLWLLIAPFLLFTR